MDNYILKFPVQAGLLVKNQIVRHLESYCFMKDLKCTHVEDKGFLESVVHFKIEGPEDVMFEACRDLKRYFAQYD